MIPVTLTWPNSSMTNASVILPNRIIIAGMHSPATTEARTPKNIKTRSSEVE